MVNFQLEAWSAIASGLNTKQDWQKWLENPTVPEEPVGKVAMQQIPPMLRRRFSTPGKCALGAALPILAEVETIPGIFASRHGDIRLTLSLLEGIGRDEPMSPTGFSLAVHNAVSGLFSIARKDTSEVTAIAAMEGLVIQTLFEAVGQLQVSERVLCVIYDIPLPEPYSHYVDSDQFPYAIAMVLSRTNGESYHLVQVDQPDQNEQGNSFLPDDLQSEPLRFIEMLSGKTALVESKLNGTIWRIEKGQSWSKK